MERILTVKQISNYISGVFEDELILHDILVSGEIFEFKSSSNNTFIVLKEDDVILECYKFGKLESYNKGDKVAIRGKIRYYARGGKVSLAISDIKAVGEGKFHIQLQRLKETLHKEGLFDNKNKLPLFVKKVAIITSAEGAVIHDFRSVIHKGHDYIQTELYNVSVQGDNAITEIVSAIQQINRVTSDISGHPSADVIVIARGGGSFQDLLPFNSEEIARAVYGSKIPIISAVGHETDYTLCDFCSVLRTPTPSLAAESIVKINQDWLNRVYFLLNRMLELVTNKHSQRQSYVSLLTRKLAYENMLSLERIENRMTTRLKRVYSRLVQKLMLSEGEVRQKIIQLDSSMQKVFANVGQKFNTLNAKLDSLSPLKLMATGYARVSADGCSISSVKKVKPNQIVRVTFFDGSLTAKVIET